MTPPLRQIRALFDDDTITVYQAYSPAIADAALAAGTFVAPFKLDRMTWIKPSFLWMMYRCGWATKPGQERVLAVRMTRTGFEEALTRAALSHFDPELYPSYESWQQTKDSSPVRVQWDPERDIDLRPLPWRSIQIGLGGPTVRAYVADWITGIADMTDRVQATRQSATPDPAMLPVERPYPLPHSVAMKIGAAPES